jgi:hypothetical protein
VTAPYDLFGGNSDGGVNMEIWLEVMCQGCVKDRGRGPSGGMGGMSCELPARAYCDPDKDIAEWSPDASPLPERLAEEYGMHAPVCLAFTPRRKRSDAGVRRGHPVTGMEPLFGEAS